MGRFFLSYVHIVKNFYGISFETFWNINLLVAFSVLMTGVIHVRLLWFCHISRRRIFHVLSVSRSNIVTLKFGYSRHPFLSLLSARKINLFWNYKTFYWPSLLDRIKIHFITLIFNLCHTNFIWIMDFHGGRVIEYLLQLNQPWDGATLKAVPI